ncbi:sugar transferase [Maribacter sp. 2307UL18-2]|uniref:sugar transferase n=1 Tax=Maribacter sp. 2307UL18-2 TaxID=3386274 RepID=UPI0039BD0F81
MNEVFFVHSVSASVLDPRPSITTSALPKASLPKPSVNTHSDVPIDFHFNHEVGEFISKYLMRYNLNDIKLFNTRSSDEIIFNAASKTKVIVNFKRINDYRKVNRFFEDMNSLLQTDDLFISNIETHTKRKERILKNIPSPFKGLYYGIDFIFHRIIPKLNYLKKLYFKQTKGYGRVLTKAEAYGRLYSCGFEIIEDVLIDGQLHFVAKKRSAPCYDYKPTYGPLIKLKRVGKGGKMIHVFKIRTMHPYAEYLQEYLYNKNSLNPGGKIKDDFRISKLGRTFRKYWIDEIPMLLNFFRGELKLVGIRPLSEHYFGLYPETLQLKRAKFRPGIFPPFYADMPKTLDEIVASEEKYLDQYMKNPMLTDLKYFFMIFQNIVFKGKRSA